MPLKTSADEQASLNLTPMIDILFLLIIFFMAGTEFTKMEERQIGLKVPEVSGAEALTDPPERKVVSVHKDGHITLGHTPVTLEELKVELVAGRSQYRDLGVMVRGDMHVFWQKMAEVMTVCKQAGIQELATSVRPIPQEM